RLSVGGVDRGRAYAVQAPGGGVGERSSDMSALTPTTASVNGPWARLELEADFYMPTTMHLAGADGVVLDTMSGDPMELHRGLRHEATEVALRVTAGELESPVMPLAESVRIVQLMQELVSSLR